MTKQDFINYLSHPENLNGNSISELEKLVKEYPYFQTGRMLYLKNLHNENSIDYEKNLHITSAYAPSGKVLYNLIKKKPDDSRQPAEIKAVQVEASVTQSVEVFPKLEQIVVLQEMQMTAEENVSIPIVIETPETKDEYDELQLLEKEMLREAYRTSMTIDLVEEESKVEVVKSEKNPKAQTLISKSGTYSFGDWMKVVSGQTPASGVEEKAVQKKKTNQIIDNFLLEETIKVTAKTKTEFYSADTMAKKSIQDDETFVSETLASIYLRQGNLPKALRAYEILLVKYPEKIHIFALLLEKIKKLLKDQKSK